MRKIFGWTVVILIGLSLLFGSRNSDPQPVTPVPEQTALEFLWRAATPTDRDSLCRDWREDKETFLDTFAQQAGPNGGFAREDVRGFFDGKCP